MLHTPEVQNLRAQRKRLTLLERLLAQLMGSGDPGSPQARRSLLRLIASWRRHRLCRFESASAPPSRRGTTWSATDALTCLPCNRQTRHHGLYLSCALASARHSRVS